jgi:hypothetical protein
MHPTLSNNIKPIVVDAPQRSDQWFAARLGNVTASVVSDTMAYAKPNAAQMAQAMLIYQQCEIDEAYIQEVSVKWPWKFCLDVGIELKESTARQSLRQKLVAERITHMSGDTDKYVTEEMKWGIINEGIAIGLYRMRNKVITRTAPLYLHPNLLCGASPDADVEEADTGEEGNAEVKCLASRNHLYKVIRDNEVPDEYLPQIYMQMWIKNVRWCDFIAYDSRVADGLEIFIKRVEYDAFYIHQVLEPAVRQFLAECDHDERVFAAIRRRNLELAKAKAEDLAERAALNAQAVAA